MGASLFRASNLSDSQTNSLSIKYLILDLCQEEKWMKWLTILEIKPESRWGDRSAAKSRSRLLAPRSAKSRMKPRAADGSISGCICSPQTLRPATPKAWTRQTSEAARTEHSAGQASDLVEMMLKDKGLAGRPQERARRQYGDRKPTHLGGRTAADAGRPVKSVSQKLVTIAAAQDGGAAGKGLPDELGLGLRPGLALQDGSLGSGQDDVAEIRGGRGEAAFGGAEGAPRDVQIARPMLDRLVDVGLDGIVDDGDLSF